MEALDVFQVPSTFASTFAEASVDKQATVDRRSRFQVENDDVSVLRGWRGTQLGEPTRTFSRDLLLFLLFCVSAPLRETDLRVRNRST